MRVLSRVALVIVLLTVSSAALADHLQGDCPLTLVGEVPGVENLGVSPHGVFRSNGSVFALRGQTLTTYSANSAGELTLVRDDVISLLAGREPEAGTLVHNGYLYVSSEAGLEVFDLRNVGSGAVAPQFVSRTSGRHYRRLAANGGILAALYPASDLPCYPRGTSFCFNTIDIIDISNPAAPTVVSTISSQTTGILGFNDIAFNQGFLYAAGEGATVGYSLGNPALPSVFTTVTGRGLFLASNGTNLLGVGTEGAIEMFTVSIVGGTSRFAIYTLPNAEGIDRANPIQFHPQAAIDEQNGRLITLIDERDPHTLDSARTIAFDVFDFSVPMYEGAYERGYENVSYLSTDEIKYNPVSVGSQVLVVGELSGLQAWGACGVAAGKIEWGGVGGLSCNGAELRGWVTGRERITNVELFIDGDSLGFASLAGPLRLDIPSRTPVQTWRVSVNLDTTSRGEHFIRAVATDASGVRRQFASQRILFAGSPNNCTSRRRSAAR